MCRFVITNENDSHFKSVLHQGYEIGGPGSCKGDSGGPIVRYIDVEDRYELVGIVQGGVAECGHPDFPGIFVRIGEPEVLSFIKDASNSKLHF